MKRIRKIETAVSTYDADLSSDVNAFEKALAAIFVKVRRDLLLYLSQFTSGERVIKLTATNLRLARRIGPTLSRSLRKNGYYTAVNQFVAKFSDQIERLEVLISKLPGAEKFAMRWNERDKLLARELQQQAIQQLDGVAASFVRGVERQINFSVGNASFAEATEMIEKTIDVTTVQAKTLADTGMSMFFATMNGRKNEQNGITRYYYAGPLDRLTRPFCRELIEHGRIFTREQIDAMDNHQLPNVFITRGGYNCRHQWVGVTDDNKDLLQASSAPEPEEKDNG